MNKETLKDTIIVRGNRGCDLPGGKLCAIGTGARGLIGLVGHFPGINRPQRRHSKVSACID